MGGDVCTGFWWENLREGNPWGDIDIDERIILRRNFRKWDMDWIKLAQDRDRWRALVNVVINLRVR
jgi:hypothetical protein